ncbi:MAG: hypothetical protein KA146_06640 [Leptospiraceae bacterium]|nr:hypothetical protein [Leptospiraceae bacterium]
MKLLFIFFIFLFTTIIAKDASKTNKGKLIEREVEIIRVKEDPDTKTNQYLPKQPEENKLSQDSNTQSNGSTCKK